MKRTTMEKSTITESATEKSAKRGRKRKVVRQAWEIATEPCCNWLSTLGISAITNRNWCVGPLNGVDLCRTSSGSEEKRRSEELLIRLVSEECIRTSRKGCKGFLRVLVYNSASQQQLSDLWQALTSLTSSSLKGWNLSLALLMPKPVAE